MAHLSEETLTLLALGETRDPRNQQHLDACPECAAELASLERVVRAAAGFARGRRGKLTSVDKANVLESSRLWREVVTNLHAAEFSDTPLEHALVSLVGDGSTEHLVIEPLDSLQHLLPAREALEQGGAKPAILNAANEIAVAAFLEERIGFLDIASIAGETLQCYETPAPASIDSSRLMVRHSVDLPEPEGPMTTTTSPRLIERSMSCRTWRSPNHFCTSSSTTSGWPRAAVMLAGGVTVMRAT